MAVSKRLRFEVLRRDNHACRYCGRSAPEVRLTVDHVVPVALGGTDQPDNLVAACSDCNAGKSSVPADAAVVADVAEDALRWSRAMAQAAEVFMADREARLDRRDAFLELWDVWKFKLNGYMNQPWPLPGDWGSSIDMMSAAGATLGDFDEAIEAALGGKGISDRWRYFCGVAWRIIARKHEMARTILESETSDAP